MNLDIRGLCFSYNRQAPVFSGFDLSLKAGAIYHLAGVNGAGKTTLLRLLCGVLRPDEGNIFVDGAKYRPDREGNRLVALAMQNPDQQWTDITVAADLRRRFSLRAGGAGAGPAIQVEAHWRGIFDDPQLFDSHVLDIPRAMRRRLSWLWPLSGVLAWSVFDEPTLGQDNETVRWFVAALAELTRRGHGVILVSHDERLYDALPCQHLQIHDQRKVTIE